MLQRLSFHSLRLEFRLCIVDANTARAHGAQGARVLRESREHRVHEMGVSRLWDLLAPCGRRVSLESLARKRLAVDASIWLIQFIKAMRDDSGEMLQNAPVLGLFRRLCKLLFLHIYPVLVFDGATPPLKQKTVARRRAFRERQESSLRHTAEKILLNQVSAGTRARTHARTYARTRSPMHTRARTCARARGFSAAAPRRHWCADEGSPPSPRAGG